MSSDAKEGITLVTCVMNRIDNLVKAFESWVNVDEINEIIIVDWNSDQPITYEIFNASDKEINIIRVENEKYWILTHAYNLGITSAKYDKILKVDCDVILKTEFCKNHILEKNEFYTGNWEIARDENEVHLNGMLMCFKCDFFEVGGYHEGLVTYGWDDDDLYQRLSSNQLNRKDFDYNMCEHIKCETNIRTENQKTLDISDFLEVGDTSEMSQSKIRERKRMTTELKKLKVDSTVSNLSEWYSTQKNRIWVNNNKWSKSSNKVTWIDFTENGYVNKTSRKFKVYLSGSSKNVSILYYEAYKEYVKKYFDICKTIEEADFIVLSFVNDIIGDFKKYERIINKKNLKTIILSEEPLWDCSYTTSLKFGKHGYYLENNRGNRRIDLQLINYGNSPSIFEYKEFPHFLTTSDAYIRNYEILFNDIKNNQITEILDSKTLDMTGVYTVKNYFNENTLLKLNEVKEGDNIDKFKIDLADKFRSSTELNCEFYGKGNATCKELTETTIYDGDKFHYSKLKWSLKNAKFLFCFENTVCKYYITEKIFDAVASLSVPVFFLTENQKNEFIGINVYELNASDVDDAYEKIVNKMKEIDIQHVVTTNLNIMSKYLTNYTEKIEEEKKERVTNLYKRFMQIYMDTLYDD